MRARCWHRWVAVAGLAAGCGGAAGAPPVPPAPPAPPVLVGPQAEAPGGDEPAAPVSELADPVVDGRRVSDWVRALCGRSPDHAARGALQRAGDAARPWLARALADPKRPHRERVVDVILELDLLDEGIAAALATALADRSVALRRAAADALSRLAEDPAREERRDAAEAERRAREGSAGAVRRGVVSPERAAVELGEALGKLGRRRTPSRRPTIDPPPWPELDEWHARATARIAVLPRVAALVAPALVAALTDADERVRDDTHRAIVALGELAAPALANGLRHGDAMRPAAIAEVAYRVGPELAPVAPALASALEGAPLELRRTLCAALAQIGAGDAATAHMLVQQLAIDDLAVAHAAAQALQRMGEAALAALPPMLEMLARPDPLPVEGRRVATWTLAVWGPGAADAVSVCVKLARTDLDERVRAHALTALGEIGVLNEAVFNALRDAVEDHAPAPCEATLAACGRLRGQAIDILAWALTHPRPAVPQLAAMALAKTGRDAAPAEAQLLRVLGDPLAAWWAVDSLVAIGTPIERFQPFLDAKLGDPVGHQRRWAVSVLGRLGARAAGFLPRALARLADDDDETVRAAAAGALPLLAPEDPRIVDALAKACLDPEGYVRREAARALGTLGEAAASATEALVRAAAIQSDTADGVASAALLALGEIGRAALPTLERLAADASEPPAVRSIAARAIALIPGR